MPMLKEAKNELASLSSGERVLAGLITQTTGIIALLDPTMTGSAKEMFAATLVTGGAFITAKGLGQLEVELE